MTYYLNKRSIESFDMINLFSYSRKNFISGKELWPYRVGCVSPHLIASVTGSMISTIEKHFKETVSKSECAQQMQSAACLFCPTYSCDTYYLSERPISISGFYISAFIQFGFHINRRHHLIVFK